MDRIVMEKKMKEKIEVGYIGNLYKIPEYIYHNPDYFLNYVIVEQGKMSNEMYTFLLVRNIAWTEVKNGGELTKTIQDTGIMKWVTCSYGKRIPKEKIDADIYNIHYGDLPAYKGRHPSFWATVKDERSMGISLHEVNEKIDEGPVIAKKTVPYYLWMNEEDLFHCLTKQVPSLLEELRLYLAGKGKAVENAGGTYYPVVSEKDYTIDLEHDSCAEIFNKVRAQSRYRGARLAADGKEVWVRHFVFSPVPCSKDGCLCVKMREHVYLVIDEMGMENE